MLRSPVIRLTEDSRGRVSRWQTLALLVVLPAILAAMRRP
jgi:hypothetical protein